MNIFFRRASETAASTTSTALLQRHILTLCTATRVEDIRSSINALFDIGTNLQIDSALMDGFVRVLGEFKGDIGLVTAVLSILGDERTFELSVQEAFVKAGGIEACTELLKITMSNTNRLNLLRLLHSVIHATAVMSFIIAIGPLVDYLRSPNEMIQLQAIKVLVHLLAQPANIGELQKIAVFAGALDACLALLEYEDAWVCIKLLLSRNSTTRQTFIEECDGINKMLNVKDIPCSTQMMSIASLLIEQSTKKQSIRASMLRAGYKEKATRLVSDDDSLEQLALNRAVFDFLSPLSPPDLSEELISITTKSALLDNETSAALLYETCIKRPVKDLTRPLSFRLLASSQEDPQASSLLAALRSTDPVGALYCFIVKNVNLLSDSIVIQLLIEQVMMDDNLSGGLASCLLLLQLEHQPADAGYTPDTLRAILKDRVGGETIGQKLEKIKEDSRLNIRRLSPFVERARRQLTGEESIEGLKRENEELRQQINVYQTQLLDMEEEHTHMLVILGQYDAEIAQLRSLLPTTSQEDFKTEPTTFFSNQSSQPPFLPSSTMQEGMMMVAPQDVDTYKSPMMDPDPFEAVRATLILGDASDDDAEWINNLLTTPKQSFNPQPDGEAQLHASIGNVNVAEEHLQACMPTVRIPELNPPTTHHYQPLLPPSIQHPVNLAQDNDSKPEETLESSATAQLNQQVIQGRTRNNRASPPSTHF